MGHQMTPQRISGTGMAAFAAAALFLAAAPLRAAGPTDILLASASVREHQPAGTVVGILRSVDLDAGDTASFSLVAGTGSADNASFSVSGDTLLTAATFDHATKSAFQVRVRARDRSGNTVDKALTVSVTPPATVAAVAAWLDANPLVKAATTAAFDRETLDYFWMHQNALAATGAVDVDVPAATPSASAMTGTWTVVLTSLEAKRVVAAKAAHAVWLDLNGRVAWRLSGYTVDQLRGLFDAATVFDPQGSAPFAFTDIVDHSPSDGYRYAVAHGLVRATAADTVRAVLDDLRSDFTHALSDGTDPLAAATLATELSSYYPKGLYPMRVSRAGCHTSARILLALLRSLNIPGTLAFLGEYFLPGHSEAVLPTLGAVLAHGDDLYSADLDATPVDQLLVPFQYYADNPSTAPCAGGKPCLSLRYHAQRGLAYPTPTILTGVKSPSTFGYTSAVDFLTKYAGWNQGLTATELQQAATTLQGGFNDTRRLTLVPTAKGWIVNVPWALDYVTGSRVSLKAVPKAGYAFLRWTGNVPSGQETANPLVFQLTDARTVQALWTGPAIPPATPSPTNNGPACEGGTISLQASFTLNTAWAWTGPNGFTAGTYSVALTNVTAAMAGDYSVTATVDGDASAPGKTTVVVKPRPASAITAPSAAPQGTTFTASVPASPGATYNWSAVTNGTIVSGQNTPTVTVRAAAIGTLGLRVYVTGSNGCVSLAGNAQVAVTDPLKLSLQSGKVSVKVDWKSQYSGASGTATAVPKGDAYGYFAFSEVANPEVFVKVLDFGAGSPYLLFWGGLTDFEYTVTFTNVATNASVSFHKAPGSTAGGVSTTALPHAVAAAWDGRSASATLLGPSASLESLGARREEGTAGPAGDDTPRAAFFQGEAGPAATGEILLAGGKVAVSVTWRSQYDGSGGSAIPVPQADGFAFFAFTDTNNPEVFVKALDWGAPSPYKVFAAGLSDFSFAVTFRNVATGVSAVFNKAAGAYDGYGADLAR